jgi:hypothetical protein
VHCAVESLVFINLGLDSCKCKLMWVISHLFVKRISLFDVQNTVCAHLFNPTVYLVSVKT